MSEKKYKNIIEDIKIVRAFIEAFVKYEEEKLKNGKSLKGNKESY